MLNAVQKPREVKTGSGKSTGNISESCSAAVRGQEPNRSGLRCGVRRCGNGASKNIQHL